MRIGRPVRAELEVPDAAQMPPRRRIVALAVEEQPMLLHQRGDVPDRIRAPG
jgi:hypothetical protein